MAQLQQGEKEVQCEADKLFGVWAHIINPAQKMCAEKVQKSVLNEGEWDKVGALLIGNRVINNIGECPSIKSRMDDIDEKNKSETHSYHDGYVLESYYRTFIDASSFKK
ncbi:hypothetical protein BVRB_2g047850 [Beta vulgaris subsp. vulgaris]|uniref:Bet v I/Major latex protein domain-containing protein n=1 Tax=Beta vulgaris subsp. vulgaris TaxID=3555 RepID=A0A0J8BGI6_BETVV|nr:uncharacterized protein LOC104906386 [Beta vulgaris subsp. vulgaris]KMS99103.1 hypothetical protein BVRB_2g047850 [Beta vulgaris subsp. vulgaris]